MPIIIIPLIVILINDFTKCIVRFFISWKFEIKWMFHSWWMPSWHSALAWSLIAITFLENWSYSIEFMIATIFWILLMYDARWIRAEAWKHAKILNEIQKNQILDESLWHTSKQVVFWAIFWFIISYLLWKTWLFLQIQ